MTEANKRITQAGPDAIHFGNRNIIYLYHEMGGRIPNLPSSAIPECCVSPCEVSLTGRTMMTIGRLETDGPPINAFTVSPQKHFERFGLLIRRRKRKKAMCKLPEDILRDLQVGELKKASQLWLNGKALKDLQRMLKNKKVQTHMKTAASMPAAFKPISHHNTQTHVNND